MRTSINFRYGNTEMDREQLIDRRLGIEQMDLIDDIEEKIEELERALKYFDLGIKDLYCRN